MFTRECTVSVYTSLNKLTNRDTLESGFKLGNVSSVRRVEDEEWRNAVLKGFTISEDIREVIEYTIQVFNSNPNDYVYRSFNNQYFKGEEGVDGGMIGEEGIVVVRMEKGEGVLAVKGERKVEMADCLKRIFER